MGRVGWKYDSVNIKSLHVIIIKIVPSFYDLACLYGP